MKWSVDEVDSWSVIEVVMWSVGNVVRGLSTVKYSDIDMVKWSVEKAVICSGENDRAVNSQAMIFVTTLMFRASVERASIMYDASLESSLSCVKLVCVCPAETPWPSPFMDYSSCGWFWLLQVSAIFLNV